MNYKAELIPPILQGDKTQTRRPAHYGEVAINPFGTPIMFTHDQDISDYFIIEQVIGVKGNIRYKVGKDYAVCPGRGKPGIMVASLQTAEGAIHKIVTEDSGQFLQSMARPARIVIDQIRFEDVRSISQEDAIAEGFKQPYEFLAVWCAFYDPAALHMHTEIRPYSVLDIAAPFGDQHKHDYLTDWSKALFKRPDHLYYGWALNFHLMR